jgi:excisionase family DNA binding protein
MTINLGTMELFTVDDLAERLKVNKRTIRGLISSRKLSARKVGRRWIVPAESLRAYFGQGQAPKRRTPGAALEARP